ncbi:Hypothetical_protein [Hexamita inflata]|uniref:Hypothetical_protein n=1 Tax=Hexamita inflata TaxID=28002 RepID=A0AA86THT4_9EUKA|nr:Hypothetical protein HINF_LOCUS6659 [Hexamita inflata]
MHRRRTYLSGISWRPAKMHARLALICAARLRNYILNLFRKEHHQLMYDFHALQIVGAECIKSCKRSPKSAQPIAIIKSTPKLGTKSLTTLQESQHRKRNKPRKNVTDWQTGHEQICSSGRPGKRQRQKRKRTNRKIIIPTKQMKQLSRLPK